MTLALIHREIINGMPYETRIVVEGWDEAWVLNELENERKGYKWPAEECQIVEVGGWRTT